MCLPRGKAFGLISNQTSVKRKWKVKTPKSAEETLPNQTQDNGEGSFTSKLVLEKWALQRVSCAKCTSAKY